MPRRVDKKAESLHLTVAVQLDQKPSPHEKGRRSRQHDSLCGHLDRRHNQCPSPSRSHPVPGQTSFQHRCDQTPQRRRLFSCVEMIVSGETSSTAQPAMNQITIDQTKTELLSIAQAFNVDIALQAEGLLSASETTGGIRHGFDPHSR